MSILINFLSKNYKLKISQKAYFVFLKREKQLHLCNVIKKNYKILLKAD